ncbi:GNAT family N-acetyltransferase [Dickeya dadantii]|uniref:GNAT family N-acetyltransferase n=1 Tax=Dickeya dadantii TaxID=204038 RepID=UPI0003A73C8E|nr:GNAT family N-acetyltransferase [Dickeya dadantii]NAT79489.1 GNAT family N-acetyltransferase [Dickeya dadantii]NPE52645.1 GNAT family N-acetyltransferase [Dickeya dadantii]NPE62005.1 GNAT family N-acetyltransferase [Dickeya dadantii]
MSLIWHDWGVKDLNPYALYDILRLRSQVFVVEQQCAYQDADGLDLVDDNRHVTAWQNGRLIACARLLAPHDGQDAVTIGRVVVAPEARGQQFGHQLLMHSQAACARHWPGRAQYLSAQAHLQHFYQQFGFVVCGDGYDEDGIPHVPMRTAG